MMRLLCPTLLDDGEPRLKSEDSFRFSEDALLGRYQNSSAGDGRQYAVFFKGSVQPGLARALRN